MVNWQEFISSHPYPLRIGTRGSKLALVQADMVYQGLIKAYPQLAEEGALQIVPIKTTGDKVTDCHLAEVGGKALFAKEIETALLENDIDIAVHSLKDMPGFLPEGLVIETALPREKPQDAFISYKVKSFNDLPEGATIGTSSPRRKAQILHARPDINIKLIRGNVETRIKKVQDEEYDATFLAVAGLRRLDKESVITEVMSEDVMRPAIGQGVVAIEHRQEDNIIKELLAPLHCSKTFACATAEREVMRTIDGDCYTPLAAHAYIEDNLIYLKAELFSLDGKKVQKAELSGPIEQAESLGKQAGNIILGHDN